VRFLRIVFMLLSIFRLATSNEAGIITNPPAWIEMSRGACMGTCPVYTLTIPRDGMVRFYGNAFTVALGTWTAQLSTEQINGLKRVIAESSFFGLAPGCCNCMDRTDASTTTLRIIDGATEKQIVHYHGCEKAPAALNELEDRIDAWAQTERWVGSKEARKRIRMGDDFGAWAKTLDVAIHFTPDSPGIKPEDLPAMQRISEFLAKYPTAQIEIQGHTDDRGTSEFLLALGQRDANTLQAWLVGKGVEASRIQTRSYGKDVPPSHARGEDQNRRCEFRLLSR
jgi:outer membrane protein OmpA-like peptidoglycan-associated protein